MNDNMSKQENCNQKFSSQNDTSYHKIIKKASSDNSLVFFIGSGFSKSTNPSLYKKWDEICEELKKDLPSLCNETDPLKIAQLYTQHFGEQVTFNRMKGMFPSKDIPGELQEILFKLKPRYVITTNWDHLLDNQVITNKTYKIVVNDSDLVNSADSAKVIKMHGDFDHYNYVFTEESYLNYSKNFPLIENFIKSVFATHVVVFIGYSFNDINVKQIINWLQTNSSYQPPVYFLNIGKQFPDNEAYLLKFGIRVINYCIYVNSNNGKVQNQIDYYASTIKFLNDIMNDNTEPTQFIYDRLACFESYPVIFRRMITDKLLYSSFEYESNGHALLEFIRGTNNKYKEFQKQLSDDLLTKNESWSLLVERILSILKKADIHGILQDSDKYRYSINDENPNLDYNFHTPLFDFDFSNSYMPVKTNNIHDLMKNIFCLYNISKYEEAFRQNQECLRNCYENEEWFNYFISVFNHNIILRELQFLLVRDGGVAIKDNPYTKIEEIDIESAFSDLSSKDKEIVKPLYDFLTFNTIYKDIFNTSKQLDVVLNQANVVKSGGQVFNSMATKYFSEHKNLIDFVLNSYLLIEVYDEFKAINKNYVNIAILRSSVKGAIKLNQYELYSCIKYFKNKDLHKLLNDYLDKKVQFNIAPENVDWLVETVLKNLVLFYTHNEKFHTRLTEYIENVIFLLAHFEIEEHLLDKVLDSLGLLVQEAGNPLDIYQALNEFIGIRFNFFGTEKSVGERVVGFINVLLVKFANNKYSFNELWAFEYNRYHNLFAYSNKANAKFNDEKLLKRVIEQIKKFEIKAKKTIDDSSLSIYSVQNDRIELNQNLLIVLYIICDEKCKTIIQEYLKSDFEKEKESYSGIDSTKKNIDIFSLKIRFYTYYFGLLIFDFISYDKKILLDLNNFIDNYPLNIFDSQLYSLNSIISDLLKKLEDSKQESTDTKFIETLQDISKKLSAIINKQETETKQFLPSQI